jgi:uncharacterized protein YwqG
MSIFENLFKRNKNESSQTENLDEHFDFLEFMRKSAIHLIKKQNLRYSKIGGVPDVPADFHWPVWKDIPLSFLCQLDLSDIPELPDNYGMPTSGYLYFFYDQEQSTWGFDPKDKGSWHITYVEHDKKLIKSELPTGMDKFFVYHEKTVEFSRIDTYPDWQDERLNKLNLTDAQIDKYIALCSSVFQNEPAHQLFGHPLPVQGNDMDLECQLVSNGLYCGDPSGYKNRKAKKLAAARTNWILLLQLDSDDDAGMMWGDVGKLYFWIRKQDLKEKRFQNAWMILQCH